MENDLLQQNEIEAANEVPELEVEDEAQEIDFIDGVQEMEVEEEQNEMVAPINELQCVKKKNVVRMNKPFQVSNLILNNLEPI